jgi:hypothetical protein
VRLADAGPTTSLIYQFHAQQWGRDLRLRKEGEGGNLVEGELDSNGLEDEEVVSLVWDLLSFRRYTSVNA